MGRKIPAKKHRGVKDPLVQQARRLETLKLKINAPPKDPDEQPVPRSLTRLFAFQNKLDKNETHKKIGNIKRLQTRKDRQTSGGNTTDVVCNPISKLQRLPGESGRDFSLRINSAVKALHNPLQLTDYPVDIEVDDVKGERMSAQRERRARKRKQNKNKQEQDTETQPQLTRTQRFALRKKEKEIKAIQSNNEKNEVVYERVMFGEVSHAPPTLHFKRKLNNNHHTLAGADSVSRPGRRDLLLTNMLRAHTEEETGATARADAERKERARQNAIDAYRKLKNDKLKHKNKL